MSNKMNFSTSFSLLYPEGSSQASSGRNHLHPDAARDLGLSALVLACDPSAEHRQEIETILTHLPQDLQVIRYRQAVLADLQRFPELTARIAALMPTIDTLGRYAYRVVKDMTTLHEVTWRMGELQSIVDCLEGLGDVFARTGSQIESQGMRRLQASIEQVRADPEYRRLVKELPGMLGSLRAAASVTIGVNLDQYLRPVEATLLSVNDKKFTTQSMLGKLFGKKVTAREGLTPLHTVPRREVNGPYALPVDPELGWAVEPLMVPLFRDLANVIEKITQPLAQELKRYTNLHSEMFVSLRQDLIFYLGLLRLVERLRAYNLPVCLPELAPMEERLCRVEGAYNANLALHLADTDLDADLSEQIVRNDLEMGPGGRILILTGPNRGGKTTFIQAVGLIQVLAQCGGLVPGSQARISPVDNIYSHFPIEEQPDADTGRFGYEARRLSEIFRHVTRASLVLLNETLSSTNASESIYLAQDVVRILRRLGARAIYSTHMHELAETVAAMNEDTPGDSRIVSVVASPVYAEPDDGRDIQRSYRIEYRPPMGRSYAREVAERYGIGYQQLERLLSERGLLK